MWKKYCWVFVLLWWTTASLEANNALDVAQSVLDRLHSINGNSRFKKPKLILNKDNNKVAAFSPWKNAIILDEKAYAICQGFGRDSLSALAFILGHELAHAYQSQIKGQQVKTNFLAYDQGYKADVRIEKTADIQGVFNAYLAGYGVLKSMPDVIERIYQEYNIKDKALQGYPSLEERKSSCREVINIAQDLCAIFESCDYLLAIGQSGLVCSGYEYILQYYQGYEIYNNLGIAYALNAQHQQLWNPNYDQFIYPFEADWNTKLTRIAQTRGQDNIDPSAEPLRQAFLDKALKNFNEALLLKPDYTAARINSVCALNLMGRPVDALKYAETHLSKYLKGKRPEQEAEMLEMTLGITYALQPGNARKAEAEKIFKRLSGSSHVLTVLFAQQNAQCLQGKPADAGNLAEIPAPESLRKMAGQMQLARVSGLERVSIDENNSIFFTRQTSAGSTTSVYSNAGGSIVSLIHFNNKLAPDARISVPQQDLTMTAYNNILATKNGFFLKSERDHLLFKVDASGRILEMVKYIEHVH